MKTNAILHRFSNTSMNILPAYFLINMIQLEQRISQYANA